ncbi:methanogenic corrinoid protein MtbC1 [Metabacillus crassostreae]|uniref:cobalamin B12-binding domain-containing protein n=1 Tax=Metabacillus crassostreae TaxID=929098 RepID=UPI00195B295C|nr:cobalamin-dependent protein [Metabacillus crassostreae]MBM7604267.1 methanogenic corrinoid protein MtbC1 [Metabacillus crassostreae]
MAWEVEEFARFLLNGDEDSAWDIAISNVNRDEGRTELFEELITKSLQLIGYLWETDQITVADEHLATSTCEYILARFHNYMKREQKIRQFSEKKALFLCLENEQHDIGLKMASQLFEEYGWKTRLLGANLPLEYALKSARHWKPHVIGLSFSIWYHAEILANYIQELEELPHKPIVIVGGRLLSNYDFSTYCSDKTRLFPSLIELKAWLMEHSVQGV